jgi:hypothetical protein
VVVKHISVNCGSCHRGCLVVFFTSVVGGLGPRVSVSYDSCPCRNLNVTKPSGPLKVALLGAARWRRAHLGLADPEPIALSPGKRSLCSEPGNTVVVMDNATMVQPG